MICRRNANEHHFTHRVEGQNLIGCKSGIIKLLFPILLGFGKIHLNTIELVAEWCMCMVYDCVSKTVQ